MVIKPVNHSEMKLSKKAGVRLAFIQLKKRFTGVNVVRPLKPTHCLHLQNITTKKIYFNF